MAHGVAKIYILHTPAVAFKLMHNYPMKVLVVHRIVRAESSSIIVIDDTVIGMGRIVCAEVCNERRDFALKFHVKRLRLRLRIFFSKLLFARVEIRLGNLYNIRQTHLIMRIELSYLERCTCLLRSFNVLTSVEVSAYTDRSKQILLVANHSSSSMSNKLLRVFSKASGEPT